jgi:DegV family protein with EDD domain
MSKTIITCDSTADLTPELYAKYDIKVIALSISLGDALRRDGMDVTCGDVFAFVDETGMLPKTSAVSVGEYEDVFRPLVEEGYEVLHINLSSHLSASHQNARLAAEEVGNVWVVDSRSLSSGTGHLVLMAQELIDAGKTAAEAAAILEEVREKLDVSFVLQTLEFLHKGGRCSGVAAFGANLMKLRPEIEVIDGKMQVGRKYRGTMEKTVLSYIRGRLEGRDDIRTDRIFITHSGVPQDIEDKAVALVKELHPFKEVLVTKAGCTISSHCGPNCLGVLFLKK